MTVFVNGKQSSEASALDRGLLYGQTVFETVALVNGKARLLEEHLKRLKLGCKALSIPLNINALKADIEAISDLAADGVDVVLRITIAMGEGGRGYANPEHAEPTTILTLHDYPKHPTSHYTQGVELGLSKVQLGHQPLLAGIKHGNRLEQVLARSQWKPDWQEAILLDQADNAVEGTQSNLIIIDGHSARTPKLDLCGVEGVMRNWVLSQLQDAGFSTQAVRLSVHDIEEADEVLLTNSIIGVWPVKRFKSKRYNKTTTAQRLIKQLHQNEIIPHY